MIPRSVAILLAAVFAAGCSKVSAGEPKVTREITIEGMHCGGCAGRVQEALLAVDGVREATVDVKAGLARVVSAASVPDAALVAAVEKAGYKAVKVAPAPEPGTAPPARPGASERRDE